MPLFTLQKIDSFNRVRDISPKSIKDAVISAIKDLDEVEHIEPWIQSILNDTNNTPHGPSEIVDILTHKIKVSGIEGMAAFVIKGKSFKTVRPSHVGHQIFRIERIKELSFSFFAASGNVLDDVKEQFISTSARLGCDFCFLDAHDLAMLFVAYGYLCPRDGKHVAGGRCSCGYSPDTRTSNILQEEALRELSASHSLGLRAGAVILPTGAGKTRVAAIDIRNFSPNICIYTAHSHEILEDAEFEFLKLYDKESVRRFDGRPVISELTKINLISVQSLSRNIDIFSNLSVDYLVVDEFHHAAAKSYRKVIDSISPKFLLGLTATPFRGDRLDVLYLCQGNVIVNYELREGIELGILCPYHYFGCFDNVDYSNILHNGVRYDIRDLERALVIPERDAAILDKWREKAEGKATLAFCCSQLHAERVARKFNSVGINAATYLSSTSRLTRAQLRESFRIGTIKVLCVVDVLNEGVDLPFAECLMFLRPTESKRVFLQQLGRGLRHYVGKKRCIVIDFIGNFKNAYRVIEYQKLDSSDEFNDGDRSAFGRSFKEIIDLPTGCVVDFDERVIDIFGYQSLNPAFATRHNIGRILVYEYQRLEKYLKRRPSKIDVDRQCRLDSSFYESVFGSWREFERKYDENKKRQQQ